jgi:hypothetical protein
MIDEDELRVGQDSTFSVYMLTSRDALGNVHLYIIRQWSICNSMVQGVDQLSIASYTPLASNDEGGIHRHYLCLARNSSLDLWIHTRRAFFSGYRPA